MILTLSARDFHSKLPMNHKLKKQLSMSDNFNYTDMELKNAKHLVFIDDVIGSGKQATKQLQVWQELNENCRYYSLLGLRQGIDYIKSQTGIAPFSAQILDEDEKAFSKTSALQAKERCKQIAEKYGKKLYYQFPDDKRHPLGYDDSQLLVCFREDCPNNTLPIIWAGVNSELPSLENSPWNSLFKRKYVPKSKKDSTISKPSTFEKYSFEFTIDLKGNAVDFDAHTTKALAEWYDNKATDMIAEMREENLRDTFSVSVKDLRIENIDQILGEIYTKCVSGVELTDYESYLSLAALKRDNAFITSAIELFLSNRNLRAVLWVNHPLKLEEMIMEILNFRYGDLGYKIPNNKELIALDVFIKATNCAKHERFIVYVKKCHLLERFGGATMWDLYQRSALELDIRDIAIYYLMYLAELDLVGFDFSKDNRMLDLSNYWIGLH